MYFIMMGIVGAHFHFMCRLKHSQMHYEKLTGTFKEWGCKWKKGWKKHHKKHEATAVVQPAQTIYVQQQQPIIQYSSVQTTSEISEERDKDMGDIVYAPAPVPNTLDANRHQMI